MPTLLPPNATQLQKDLESINGITLDTETGILKIKTIKSDPPDHILSWLIWEYGLGELLPYISDLRRVIADGLKWQRLRGTPESLKMALGWIGIADAQIEEEVPGIHFYEYQLKLPRVPSREEFANIRNLTQLSAPARARLSRIFNEDYDRRRLIPSDGPNGEFGQLLSDYSGYREHNIILSFGQRYGTGIEVPVPTIAGGRQRENLRWAYNNDHPLLSYMAIEDAPILNHRLQVSRIRSLYFARENNAPISLAGLNWYGTWKQRTWKASGFVDIGIIHGALSTVELQYTDLEIDAGLNRGITLDAVGLADQVDSGWANAVQRTISLMQENEAPLCSAGTDWFGGWDAQRTWENPLFVNIGIIRRAFDSAGNVIPDPIEVIDRLVSIHLSQPNGAPLCSAGTDWFGGWDHHRTWESPLFINIGVIHGNIN